jgi:hypothetical protein
MLRLALVILVAPCLAGATDGTAGHQADCGTIVAASASSDLDHDDAKLAGPWVAIPPCPEGVSRPAGAVVDGRLFVIGGQSSGGFLGYVQEYDPATATWDNTHQTMPTPVSNICAAVIAEDIFVPGGWDGATSVTNMQFYSVTHETWYTQVSDPVPYAPSGAACAAFDGKVYVFGGTEASVFTDLAFVYDPAAPNGARWSPLAPAPVAAAYGDAIAAAGGIFYAGMLGPGLQDMADVYKYEPASDSWTAYPPLNTPRGGARMWVYEGKLAVGGGGWTGYLTSVEEYDLQAGTGGLWRTTYPFIVGRRTFAAAQDPRNGSLYAAAGWAGAYLTDAELSPFMLPMSFFDNRAAFDVAVPGLPIEDFEEGNVPPGGATICDDPYDSNTNDACWTPGDILPDLRLGSNRGAAMAIWGDGVFGQPTIVTGAGFFTDYSYLEFPRGVFAVGLDLLSNTPGTMADVRIFGNYGQIGSAYVPTDVPGPFWGVLSTELITRIEIDPFIGVGELVDNVAFGGTGTLFADGFEYGNTAAWSRSGP